MPLHNIPDEEIQDAGRNYGKENPFAGTEYEEMWLNNPYRNTYLDPTFWDNIGLSHKSRDYNAEQDRLYNEYIAGIYELLMQNKYDSEAAKAARMRAAGQNPDLLGLNNASESDDMTPPNAGPSSSLNGQSPALSSLQMLGSIMSFALNSYQGIASTINTIDAQNIKNIQDLATAARPFVTQSFAEAFMNDYDLHTSVASGRDSFARRYNRRLRKSAENVFEHMFYSGDYELQRKALQNMSGAFDDNIGFQARRLFENKDSGNAVQTFLDEMVKLGIEEYKVNRNRNISTAKKDKILSDFRYSSIERLRKNWEKSEGTDMLSGLLLIGMLESTGTSFFTNPAGFMTATSRTGRDFAVKKVKQYLGLD